MEVNKLHYYNKSKHTLACINKHPSHTCTLTHTTHTHHTHHTFTTHTHTRHTHTQRTHTHTACIHTLQVECCLDAIIDYSTLQYNGTFTNPCLFLLSDIIGRKFILEWQDAHRSSFGCNITLKSPNAFK